MDTLIKNVQIVTFDKDKPFIKNGAILVSDNLIKKVYIKEALEYINFKGKVVDGMGKLVMPGFISMHTHIYSAFARGMGLKGKPTRNFSEILENLWWHLDDNLTLEDIYYSAQVTILESIKSGVTCIFDHHASFNAIDGSLDVIEKAFKDLNMRGALCYEVSDRRGEKKAQMSLDENMRFFKKKREGDMVASLFGLHAAYTLSDSTLEKAASYGNSAGMGFHIHVAEGKIDADKSMEEHGVSILKRLNNMNIINDKSLLCHCIHINEEDKELLKESNVIHNPESNMNNAVGYCDAVDLLRKGILVGIGSDGFSADHLRALDCTYVLHKHEHGNPCYISGEDVVDMGIYNNSIIASKFFSNPVGVLKEGAKADLIMLDYKAPTELNENNIPYHMIFGFSKRDITDVMINGEFAMKNGVIDGVIDGIDCAHIYQKSRELSKKLWDRM